MCIVVDTNNISRVFNQRNAENAEFLPVFNWIVNGNGKLVLGGTTFDSEIAKFNWFLNFLVELKRANKTVRMNSEAVDELEEKIKSEIPVGTDFDDPHIVSLLAISKCKLICTDDARSFEYVTKSKYYDKSHKPKIYTSSKNKDLLRDGNICACCFPKVKLNKKQAIIFNQLREKPSK